MKWIRRKLRNWLGISALEGKTENRLRGIENLVQIGVDLGFKTPSWIVVCLRGKEHQSDVVRFFELPDREIADIFEWLKEAEKRYGLKPVIDAPPYIKKEYLRF